MALFSKKKTADKVVSGTVMTSDVMSLIMRPHITEKTALRSGDSTYVFEVSSRATKQEIAKAITALYKVTPVKVNIINTPSKKVASRTKRGVIGTKSGMKKAYVYLKKGDKIEFV